MLAQFVGMPKKFEQPKEPEFQLRREGFKVDSKKMQQQSIKQANETKKQQIDLLLKQTKKLAEAYFQNNDRTSKSTDDVGDVSPNSDNQTDRSSTPINSFRTKSAEETKVNLTQISDESLFKE